MNAIRAWVCFSLVRAYFPNLSAHLLPHDVRSSEGGGGGGGSKKAGSGGLSRNNYPLSYASFTAYKLASNREFCSSEKGARDTCEIPL